MAPKAAAAAQVREHAALKKALGAKPEWEKCNLIHMEVGDGGCKTIAKLVPRFQKIFELQLQFNGITDEGLNELCKQNGVVSSQDGRSVAVLDLSSNAFTAMGIMALARAAATSPTLVSLTLNKNTLGTEGALAIAPALRESQKLACLSMRKTKLTREAAAALAEAFGRSPLTSLDLSENALEGQGIGLLAEALPSSLVELKLYKTGMGPEGVRALTEPLRDPTGWAARGGGSLAPSLQRLDVANNALGVEGAAHLAAALGSDACTWTWLSATFNALGAEGAGALAQPLGRTPSPQLRELRLGSNDLGPDGLRQLVDALQRNTVLEGLYLRRNGLGPQGGRILAAALPQLRLRRLGLQDNQLGNEGVMAICAGLAECAVVDVELDLNGFSDPAAVALAEMLERRGDFERLLLGRNRIGRKPAGFPEDSEDEEEEYDESGERSTVRAARRLQGILAAHESLAELHVERNRLGWGSLNLLQGLEGNRALRILNLSGNRIMDQGLELLEQKVPGSALEQLFIDKCYFYRDVMIRCLGSLVENSKQLKVLSMSENGMRDPQAAVLSESLRGCSLESISMAWNEISNAGAIRLAAALPETRLQFVSLEGNRIQKEGALELIRATVMMKDLGEFNLKQNEFEKHQLVRVKKQLDERDEELWKVFKDASFEHAKKHAKSPPKLRLGGPDRDDATSDEDEDGDGAGAP